VLLATDFEVVLFLSVDDELGFPVDFGLLGVDVVFFVVELFKALELLDLPPEPKGTILPSNGFIVAPELDFLVVVLLSVFFVFAILF
jgi:hypothetical protein